MRLTPVKETRARFDSGVYEYRPETVKKNRPSKTSNVFDETTDRDFQRIDVHNYQSNTTVPSTEASEKHTALSVTEVSKRTKPLIPKRRLIIKGKKKKQIKKEFSDLLTKENVVNEILQAKVNYFFKPYSGEVNIDREPPMSFKEEQGQAPSNTESESSYSQDAKFNWNRL